MTFKTNGMWIWSNIWDLLSTRSSYNYIHILNEKIKWMTLAKKIIKESTSSCQKPFDLSGKNGTILKVHLCTQISSLLEPNTYRSYTKYVTTNPLMSMKNQQWLYSDLSTFMYNKCFIQWTIIRLLEIDQNPKSNPLRHRLLINLLLIHFSLGSCLDMVITVQYLLLLNSWITNS